MLGSNLKFRGQNLGYLSPIFLEAKFGAPKIISEANFGAKPPDLLIWKNHPGPTQWIHERWAPSKMCDEQSNLVTWDEGSWQSKMNKQNPFQGYL